MLCGSHSPNLRRQTRKRLRLVLLGLIALLYLASVPWYRDLDAPLRLVLGLPDWVAVALVCYAAAACLNAVAWLLSDSAGDAEEGENSASPAAAPPAPPAAPLGGEPPR